MGGAVDTASGREVIKSLTIMNRYPRLPRLLALGLLWATAALAQPGGPLPGPLPLLPSDNWWNVDVSAAPLDPGSAGYVNFIGRGVGLHPDFGGDADAFADIFGMVYLSVPGSQPLVPVTFVEFGDESDAGAPGRPAGYPIPPEAKTTAKWIEGGQPGTEVGGDRHMLIVDRDNRILYELYHAHWNQARSRWEAGSGAVFPLTSNRRRPEGWTSADAAGLAILPGLVRWDEVFGAGPIQHASASQSRSPTATSSRPPTMPGARPGPCPWAPACASRPARTSRAICRRCARSFRR